MNEINDENSKKEMLDMLNEIERIANVAGFTYYLAYGSALGAIRHQGFIPWDNDIDIIIDINQYEDFCNMINELIDNNYEVKTFYLDSNYDSLKARVSRKNLNHTFLHVDIFPMVGTPDSKVGRKIFSKISYFNYRCFFFKKMDPKINYNQNILKRFIAYTIKFLLSPLPAKLFIKIFNNLSKRFPMGTSKKIYNICGSYGDKEFIDKNWLREPTYVKFENKQFPIPKEWDKYLTHLYSDYMTPKKSDYV